MLIQRQKCHLEWITVEIVWNAQQHHKRKSRFKIMQIIEILLHNLIILIINKLSYFEHYITWLSYEFTPTLGLTVLIHVSDSP